MKLADKNWDAIATIEKANLDAKERQLAAAKRAQEREREAKAAATASSNSPVDAGDAKWAATLAPVAASSLESSSAANRSAASERKSKALASAEAFNVKLILGDFFEVDWSDADVIFANSTW